MAGLEIFAVVSEMQKLVGKRIRRLKLAKEGVYELQLGSSWLVIDLKFGCFLGPIFEWRDDKFCERITRLIKNRRISSITQLGIDRIVEFGFSGGSLILELFGGGNIILTKEGEIQEVLNPKEWKGRKLFRKEDYKPPASLVKVPKNIEEFKKVPAIKLVGEKYRDKLEGEVEKQFKTFIELLETARRGKGSLNGEFSILGERDFSKMVSEYYLKRIVPKWGKKKSEKLEKTIEKQLKLIKEYEIKSKEYKKKGQWIFKDLGKIGEILQKVNGGEQVEGVDIKRKSRYMITLEMK